MPIGARVASASTVAPAGSGGHAPAPTVVTGGGALTQSWQPTTLSGPERSGICTLQLPAAPVGFALVVDRISISTTSTQATTCSVYLGPVSDGAQVDYSQSANLDFSDYPPRGLLVPGGKPLTLVFSSLSAGSTAKAVVQWALVSSAQLPAVAGSIP